MVVSLKEFQKMQKELKVLQDEMQLVQERQEILLRNDVALKQTFDKQIGEKKEPTYFG